MPRLKTYKDQMKKLPRFKRKKSSAAAETPHRITNETVAEHREQILAGGRRFKYPMQYARHRLVITTIIISIVALVAIIAVTWWQLYSVQNTSTFFYRITKVLPLPVAKVDGQDVPYSDYLMGFRSQEHYLQFKEGVDLYSKENKSQLEWIKRRAMNDAVSDNYAVKLAKEKNISITDKQIDEAILRQRQSRDGITSQETYDAIVLDHFDWTPAEAREVTAHKLLRQEVSFEIDDSATKLRDQLVVKLKSETDFDKIASSIAAVGKAKVESSVTPLVPSNNQDGGQAEAASKLAVGQVSPPFRSTTGDGYYVVKLLQKDNNDRISYASLKIPLTAFKEKLETIKRDRKIQEYISVPQVKDPSSV